MLLLRSATLLVPASLVHCCPPKLALLRVHLCAKSLGLVYAATDIKIYFLDTSANLCRYGGLPRSLNQSLNTITLFNLAILHGCNRKLLGRVSSYSAHQ